MVSSINTRMMIDKEMKPRTRLVKFDAFSRHLQSYYKKLQTVDTVDAWREISMEGVRSMQPAFSTTCRHRVNVAQSAILNDTDMGPALTNERKENAAVRFGSVGELILGSWRTLAMSRGFRQGLGDREESKVSNRPKGM
jgi:hypothetical protein